MTLQQQFLALLRAGLYRDSMNGVEATEIPSSESLPWGDLFRLAQQQAVTPLVYEGIMCLPEQQRPQGNAKQPWFAATLQVEMLNKRMLQRMQTLWHEYRVAGVRAVLLKGASVGHFYANPHRRMCGDIDVLFPREGEAQKADAHIRTLGLTPKFDVMFHKHSEFHWHEFSVEHHYYLQEFRHTGYRAFVDNLVAQAFSEKPRTVVALSEGFEVEVLPVDFNLFFQLLHITSHLVQSGIGLRQFCDLARFIHAHRDAFHRERIDSWITQLGMRAAASAIGHILVAWLGTPEEALPFTIDIHEPLIPFVEHDVWHGGNFGYAYLQKFGYRRGLRGYGAWLWASNKRLWLYRRIFPREFCAGYSYRLRRVLIRLFRTGSPIK